MLKTLFGGTEALAGLSTSPVHSSLEQRINTVGYGYPHTEVHVNVKMLYKL